MPHSCASPSCPLGADGQSDCTAHLFDMLRDVTAFFHARGIAYYVTAGTLLGIVRDNSTIPGNGDLDIFLHADQRPAAMALNNATFDGRTYQIGFDEGTLGRVCRTDGPGPPQRGTGWDLFQKVDFYIDVIGDQHELHQAIDTAKHLVYPTKNITFRDIQVAAPAQTEVLLEAFYGPGWKQPDSNPDGHSADYPYTYMKPDQYKFFLQHLANPADLPGAQSETTATTALKHEPALSLEDMWSTFLVTSLALTALHFLVAFMYRAAQQTNAGPGEDGSSRPRLEFINGMRAVIAIVIIWSHFALGPRGNLPEIVYVLLQSASATRACPTSSC